MSTGDLHKPETNPLAKLLLIGPIVLGGTELFFDTRKVSVFEASFL